MAATAISLHLRPNRHRLFQNPNFINFFSSSSSSDDPSSPPPPPPQPKPQSSYSSSYYTELKASLEQHYPPPQQQQQQHHHRSFSPSPTNASSSKDASFDELRKNLLEFRRRINAPPPNSAGQQLVSLQELYKRNVPGKDYLNQPGNGNDMPGPPPINTIKQSLKQTNSSLDGIRMSLIDRVNESFNRLPSNENSESFIKYPSNLKQALVSLDKGDDKAKKSNKMGKSKDNDNKCQFRWTSPMERTLLQLLAEEAQLGNKPSNTFKHSSIVRVANVVSEKHGTQCEPKHVENRLRTIKAIWNTITNLRNKSGFGWDDNLKMITCSKENFEEEIAAHPKHEKFLNTKIEMFDEMTMVVGKDMATGCFAKSFNDIDLEASTGNNSAQDVEDNDFEEVTKQKETSSIGLSSKSRSHRKRTREDVDSSFDLLAGQVGEVANAIKKLSDDKVNTEDLYKEVMKTEGFDEEFLGSVFDHLNANPSLAKGFMVKSENLRLKWIEKFMTKERQGY